MANKILYLIVGKKITPDAASFSYFNRKRLHGIWCDKKY